MEKHVHLNTVIFILHYVLGKTSSFVCVYVCASRRFFFCICFVLCLDLMINNGKFPQGTPVLLESLNQIPSQAMSNSTQPRTVEVKKECVHVDGRDGSTSESFLLVLESCSEGRKGCVRVREECVLRL